jgi:hypothetical protein
MDEQIKEPTEVEGEHSTSILLHAVKNNLQVLHSLCSLHGRELKDRGARSAFGRVKGGLLLFADGYDIIHRSGNPEQIAIFPFFQRIVPRIVAAHYAAIDQATDHSSQSTEKRRATTHFRGLPPPPTCSLPNILIPFSTAISWGLLMNELIADLLWNSSEDGVVRALSVEGKREGGELKIVITMAGALNSGAGSSTTNSDSYKTDPASSINEEARDSQVSKQFGTVATALAHQCEGFIRWISRKPGAIEMTVPV